VDAPSRRVESAGLGSIQPVIRRAGSQDRLAYAARIVDTNIWLRDMEESLPRARKVIASTQEESYPQFSPDGKRIAFGSNRSGITQIYIADRDGSNLLPVTSFSAGFTNAPRWAPDGKHIAFASLQSSNRDIYIVSSDGSSLRQLTRTPSNEGRPSWSRDGHWIYFYSDRTGQEVVWKIPAEGGEMVQVTQGRGHETSESPDGKLLYYEDYAVKGLQSVPPETSAAPKEGTIVLEQVRPGHWAVAEKGIYFVEFDDRSAAAYRLGRLFPASSVSHPIKLYDFRTRKITQIGAIEKEVVRASGGLSVTWDGRYIAWSQIDHAESDLMMIENFR
jgi:dipeptidyl aminopeptidase/acylaminoacyl peptidase